MEELGGEGNNILVAAATVMPSLAPDLRVIEIGHAERATRGQLVNVTYQVMNSSTAGTPASQDRWDDLFYLSRDEFLDFRADRYLGRSRHTGGLGPNERYFNTMSLQLPSDLLGAWYVFIVTDPARYSSQGDVLEGSHENNNDLTGIPLIIELPPAADLQITDITVPDTARPGEPISVQWQVTNTSTEPAAGNWADSVYLSSDANWDINDIPLGKASFSGTLDPGQSYNLSLDAVMPPTEPGDFRVIVRADIFNQVHEAEFEANNRLASPDTIRVDIDKLTIGIPLTTSLTPGQQRLYEVIVPPDQTLRVSVDASSRQMVNEVFVRHNAAPTSARFDATHNGPLADNLIAIVPSTEPGRYFVLVRGFSGPEEGGDVTLLAELLPLAITNVHTDTGGDSRHVTTHIEGAQFQEGAVVKLVRPGIAEREPVAYEVVDSSLIIATFDLTDAPHGLYDLKVINPGGQQAVLPYRFLVQRAIEPEVSIGIGGPRVVLAGDVGTYSVTFQNISNLDAPYTFFQVGTPELGLNSKVYGLPYQQLFTNVRGTPEGAIGTPNENVPWVSLDSITNTSGQQETAGYLLDQRADGHGAITFNLATYPGLRELSERAFDEFRDQVAKKFPDLDPYLADGTGGLESWWEAQIEASAEIDPALPALLSAIDFPGIFESTVAVPGECEAIFIPNRTHVYAAATSMTRDEFVAHQRQQASELRESIIADSDAPASLLALAADDRIWGDLHLAALEDAGLLRPDDGQPPIRTQQHVVSMMSMIASGVLFGPAGSDIRATGDVVGFFEQLRSWYGHNDRTMADIDDFEDRGSDKCGVGTVPVPALPEFADFDLKLSNPTRFEAFRVFVPWLPFEDRGAGLPIDFQINGPPAVDGGGLEDLNLTALLDGEAGDRLASITGPLTIDTAGWLPAGQALPYTIAMENAENASTYVSEIQVVAELDSDLDAQLCVGRHEDWRDHSSCPRRSPLIPRRLRSHRFAGIRAAGQCGRRPVVRRRDLAVTGNRSANWGSAAGSRTRSVGS